MGQKETKKTRLIKKGCQPLNPEEPSQNNVGRRVGKDSGIEGSKVLENTPDPKAAGTEFDWTIPQELNEGNPPISLVAQVYDANINDNKQQEDDESVGT